MANIVKYSNDSIKKIPVEQFAGKTFDIISGEMVILPTKTNVTIRTLLGSCVAICLIDEVAGLLAVNHFLTPAYTEDFKSGLFSTNKMLSELIKLGANLENIQAKVYGGANINQLKLFKTNIGEMNSDFAFDYLKYKKIPILKYKIQLTKGLVIQVKNNFDINTKELG